MAGPSFASDKIRNIALVGHGGCGKTSLAEAMLFLSGATGRLGRVDDETSILDFEPEEHKRRGSIATSLAWLEHDGHKINVLDTPGDQNFIFDAIHAMQGADAVVVVVSAPDGVEVQTQRVWNEAERLGLPRVIFLNKMDRDRADPEAALQDLRDRFGIRPVPLQVPLGSEGDFHGVASLFMRKALRYDRSDPGRYEKTDLPEDRIDDVDAAWENLVESVAETDEELLEQYLDSFELAPEQVRAGFQKALKRGALTPVLYGAAPSAIGGLALLELVAWAFPSPLDHAPLSGTRGEDLVEVPVSADAPFLAQIIHTHVDEASGKASLFRVFNGTPPSDNHVVNGHSGKDERLGTLFSLRGKERTPVREPVPGDLYAVAKLKHSHTGDPLCAPGAAVDLDRIPYPPPMMSYVVTPASKSDADKIKSALERLLEEDPTLSVSTDELTHHLVLNGMGQAHLDMAIERMRRKYRVHITTSLPPVPYRETLRQAVQGVEGKHKKQTGGAGQFGVAVMNVRPLERNGGFEFINKIKGGAIPNQFIPSVEKGILGRMKAGFLAGYPIVDLQVELVDGKYHPVDSKDVAFQLAGSKGLKAAFAQGGAVLLEPHMDIEIVVPTDVMGDIMGDLTSRRGRISGMEPKGRTTVIQGTVPLAEVLRYAPDLKGMTAGKGSFTLRLSGYEEVPRNLVDGIVAASPFKRTDDDD